MYDISNQMENKNDCASYNSSILKWHQWKCVSIFVSDLLDYTHLVKNTMTKWTQMVAICIDIQSHIDYLGVGERKTLRNILESPML